MGKPLLKFEDGAHWYRKDGSPNHEATLREARKEILYPSVTTIDKAVFKNDFLDRWKMEQLVIACCENPRDHEEPTQNYARRVYDISGTKARVAAEFGKSIHGVAERYPSIPSNDLLPWFTHISEWYEANISQPISQELVVVDNDIGVAGRTDLIAEGKGALTGRVIVDWKTQDVKTDDKGRKTPAFYESWPRQLAFYGSAYAKSVGLFPYMPTCVSLIIDSNQGGVVYPKVWSQEEILEAYEDFVFGAYRWFKVKKYWPTGRWRVMKDMPFFTKE